MTQQELEDRLIDFATIVIETVGLLPANTAGKHLAGQMINSGTAPALNYDEARNRVNLVPNQKAFIETSMPENNELVSIFVKTLRTLDK